MSVKIQDTFIAGNYLSFLLLDLSQKCSNLTYSPFLTLLRQAGSPASFIRFNPKLAFGTSFLKALSSKYLPPLTSNTTSEESIEKPKYSRKNLAEIEIETPNFDGVIKRAARLAKLREAGLGGWKQAPDPERPGKNIEADSGESVAVAFGEEEKEGDIRKTCPSEFCFGR